jgi:hypothetical protein
MRRERDPQGRLRDGLVNVNARSSTSHGCLVLAVLLVLSTPFL